MLAISSHQGERGQTIPFWIIAVLVSLSLTFFTYNYANTVRWQIRSQNAADSAATAILGEDAAVANSLTTLTYALQVQNVRDRSVNNDILGVVGNVGGNPQCFSVLSTSCVTQYATLALTLKKDTDQYQSIVTTLNGFAGQLTDLAGNAQSANDLLNNSLLGSGATASGVGCVKLNTDCGYHYTTKIETSPSGMLIVDVYACRPVPTVAAGLVGPLVKSKSSTFYAIGHARETLAPASDSTTNLGTGINPFTGTVYQPTEQIDPNINATENYTNFSTVNLNANYLVPKPAPPESATPQTVSALCPAASV